eukprot:5543226-Pleurochrysis_carterae.AAC.1
MLGAAHEYLFAVHAIAHPASKARSYGTPVSKAHTATELLRQGPSYNTSAFSPPPVSIIAHRSPRSQNMCMEWIQ